MMDLGITVRMQITEVSNVHHQYELIPKRLQEILQLFLQAILTALF